MHHAWTHDADTPKPLVPLGEARLGGEEGAESCDKSVKGVTNRHAK